jgi:hypothetical protein
MQLQDYVLENQKIVELVSNRVPGDSKIDMYYGTLDYATSRFNTILLKLSQDKILELDHRKEVRECFEAIQSFYNNVIRYTEWPPLFKHVVAMVLHHIGTKKIPKIKKLLQLLDN